MDDSSEGIFEEKVSPEAEKNIKRTLKTPSQIAALEEFYTEHKYPSEELKSEAAERIGLSEKQISSWFCHRRLKDKKKHDERSGSMVQDRGSGLRQDSCGSTKQGDIRTFEFKEVESERLYKSDFAAGNANSMSESSPETSSSLHEKSVSPYNRRDRNSVPTIQRSSNGVPFKPSGYLKVRGDIENAAITAVKRQLGRHYKDHGPLLGVEFDPLPPCAFSSQSRYHATASFYVGNLSRVRSPEVPAGRQLSRSDSSYQGIKPYYDSYPLHDHNHKSRLQKHEDTARGKRKAESHHLPNDDSNKTTSKSSNKPKTKSNKVKDVGQGRAPPKLDAKQYMSGVPRRDYGKEDCYPKTMGRDGSEGSTSEDETAETSDN